MYKSISTRLPLLLRFRRIAVKVREEEESPWDLIFRFSLKILYGCRPNGVGNPLNSRGSPAKDIGKNPVSKWTLPLPAYTRIYYSYKLLDVLTEWSLLSPIPLRHDLMSNVCFILHASSSKLLKFLYSRRICVVWPTNFPDRLTFFRTILSLRDRNLNRAFIQFSTPNDETEYERRNSFEQASGRGLRIYMSFPVNSHHRTRYDGAEADALLLHKRIKVQRR